MFQELLPRLALLYERGDDMQLTGREPHVCRESQVYPRTVTDAAKRRVKFPHFQRVYTEYTVDKIESHPKMLDDAVLPGSSALLRAAWRGGETSSVRRPGAAGCLEVPKYSFVTGNRTRVLFQFVSSPACKTIAMSPCCSDSKQFPVFAHLNLNLQLASAMTTSNCPAVALGTAATCRPGSRGSQDRHRPCRCSYRVVRCLWVAWLCATTCLRPRLLSCRLQVQEGWNASQEVASL